MAIKGLKLTHKAGTYLGIIFSISNVLFVFKFQCALLIVKFVTTIGTPDLCNQKSLL